MNIRFVMSDSLGGLAATVWKGCALTSSCNRASEPIGSKRICMPGTVSGSIAVFAVS
jgi:hypothetical protein